MPRLPAWLISWPPTRSSRAARSASRVAERATTCAPGRSSGFQAYGYDIAPSAIRLATQRTRSAKLSAQFQVANFLQDTPPLLFDWVFEHTLFCAIQPGERDEYARALLRWLKPGGQYLAVNYLIPDRDGPPFGTTRDELWQRFSPHLRPAAGMGAPLLPEPDGPGTDALVAQEEGSPKPESRKHRT